MEGEREAGRHQVDAIKRWGEMKLGGWVGRVGAGCLILSCWGSEDVHLVFEVRDEGGHELVLNVATWYLQSPCFIPNSCLHLVHIHL